VPSPVDTSPDVVMVDRSPRRSACKRRGIEIPTLTE
jgi:hypothetical protein